MRKAYEILFGGICEKEILSNTEINRNCQYTKDIVEYNWLFLTN